MGRYYNWRPYVPVHQRRARARRKMEQLRKQGKDIQPVEIEGRKITRTFWGKAWCDHLEAFSDYENRLPRGRTYVRNGSVCHLAITKGEVNALVSGSETYKVKIKIKTLTKKRWQQIKRRCAGQVGSLLELLRGSLSENVMQVVCDREQGIFPRPGEISLGCSCPDWAIMCKHVAAVLYGVGARLDQQPELLFLLRGVDHEELISTEVGVATTAGKSGAGRRRIADEALADVFGIELTQTEPAAPATPRRPRAAKTSRRKAKTGKETPVSDGGPRAGRKATHKKATHKKAASKSKPAHAVTGKAVAGLRAKLGLTLGEFARLLGVSTSSVSKWEKHPGRLNLQARTRQAWEAARGLTRREARKRLEQSRQAPPYSNSRKSMRS